MSTVVLRNPGHFMILGVYDSMITEAGGAAS